MTKKAADSKIKVVGSVRVNVYRVIEDAIEQGANIGIRRAHKHTNTPSHEAIENEVTREVMNALCEVLHFDEP